ncbi:MAG: penicillin-binding protein [Prolixibacteraceae bacterium]|jgi:penicillin-binding protein 1A|nr:penicillin-binding protein [Prolixibacteraceae bacterium]MBT6764173.1 penicillin-binding protein [Prolixibacteraceae bacterium]MBT6998134.1 penicillin-binding protein [Prolixibacteraceae bacterium]MBT7393950.1 penicillin-binding protein [Prolixibacteraceae bacterium]
MDKKKIEFKKYIVGFWSFVAFLVAGNVILFFLIAIGALGFMPSFEELENPRNVLASEIYSADGKVLDKYFIRENRTYVDFKNLPPKLIDALIATEDVRFFSHSGIDLRGLVRVVKGIITNNTSSGGGSTLSQQLAKMLFPRNRLENSLQLALRKFKEWVIAVKLERSYTKEEIILMYLNKYDYLNNAVGIKSAAQVYFSIPPDSLKLHQSAMLVGMAKNSSLYNPVRRPEMVQQRRNVVLNQMEKYGYISKEVRDSVKQLPLDLAYNKVDYKSGPAPYLREYLRLTIIANKPERKNYASWQEQKYIEDLDEWENNPLFGWCQKNVKPNGENYNLYSDGLRVFTTIDSRMQKYAVESIEQHLKLDLQPEFDGSIKDLDNPPFANNMTTEEVETLLDRSIRQSERFRVLSEQGKNFNEIKENFNQPVEMTIFSWKGEIDTLMSPIDSIKWYLRYFKSSFMAMETETGKVKAYVGGPNYKHFMYDMVKGGKRQVGSTVKPFLYTLAMQNGLTPCTKVPYVSQQFQLPDGSVWEPKDSEIDEENEGKLVTLKWGLANSKNKISAWVMQQFNPQAVVEVMKRLGVYSPIDPVPSLFLGTSDITLYEMVGAFTTYANQGVFIKPYFVTRIEDRRGNVVASFQPERHEAIDEQSAYLMLNLMRGVIDQGTGIRLRNREEYGQFRMPIAGKTGTTQNHSDGWFIGTTPKLSAGVWTGADLRSIHFRTLTSGQGANMALPIWGYFMKKVLADESLGITEEMEFKKPLNFNLNLDCDENEQNEQTPSDFNDFF